MFQQTLQVPSTGGHTVPVEAYVPGVSKDIAPEIRRPAIVILPGGGYSHVGTREAEPVALRFLALGFNVFTVLYRFAPHRYPAPQQDAAAVVAYVRAHAEALRTDPDKIAVMGFSAGGHLAASLGVTWQQAELWAEMGLQPADVKPNALVLGYAVLTAGEHANRGSFVNLTGTEDAAQHQQHGIEGRVTADCPPTFLWHSFDDAVVPVESSLLMAMALSAHKVEAELHVFRSGPHGAALYNEVSAGPYRPQMVVPEMAGWPEMAANFLRKVMG